jgi:hypothetical protein
MGFQPLPAEPEHTDCFVCKVSAALAQSGLMQRFLAKEENFTSSRFHP